MHLIILLSAIIFLLLVVIFIMYGKIKTVRTSELEKLVSERTKELEELDATRDKFFSIIAHDLKNPFLTLQGYSELLLTEFDSLTDKEKRDFLIQINMVAKRSYQMLENLLHWSRTKTGKIEFNPTSFNLTALLNNVLEVCTKTAELKKITLKSDVTGDVTVYADEDMMRIILRNILQNAVKFSNENGTINVTHERMDEEIVICINDDGVGMDEDTVENLFHFGKIKSRMGTAGEEGTGVGLLLCKEFVDMHKGRIWVESEPGKGSKFCISLPN